MQTSKLYVGNLDYSVTNGELEELCSTYGEVRSVNIIEYKGFGFIEMTDNAGGQSAIDNLNGKEIKGRSVKVNTAHSRTDNRRGRGKFGGGRRDGRQGKGYRF